MFGNDSCATCSMKGKCANTYSESSSNGQMIQSWNDLLTMQPRCPLEVIAWAQVTGLTAQFSLSSTFLITSGSWQTTQFSISSIAPACSATGTDSGEQVADADQWNFQHMTANAGDTLVAPPLRKIIFLRGGTKWKNQITIDIAGGGTYHDLQLTFRDNAATRGDCRGTIPVIAFTGNVTTRFYLTVTLKRTGRFTMALKALDVSNNPSMFEMEWVVVSYDNHSGSFPSDADSLRETESIVHPSKPWGPYASKAECCLHCLGTHRALGVPPQLDSTCCFWYPGKEPSCQYYFDKWFGGHGSTGSGRHGSGGGDFF